jgi:dihydroneopterin aldolase/2-amino-4-hydroxy-6-hydroxymethyldihydropteridine diphosphokinase
VGDRIELRGLRAVGTHGALPEEHDRAQPFEVDLDIDADLSTAGATDALADTIDYGAVCEAVAAVVTGPHADLLEHLAARIAETVRRVAGARAQAVTVTVRKLRPPVPVELASAAVTITRRLYVPAPPAFPPPEAPAGPEAAAPDRAPEPPAPAGSGPPGAGGAGEGRRAFVALGSNLGDRWAHLAAGLAALPDVVAVSPVYETDPVGGPGGQAPYLNAVVELRTARSPRQLLADAHAAERAEGRVRAERWGPRTLDVDVLLVGDVVVDEADLTVPHPRMWERGFVLVPLADLAPELARAHLTPEMRSGIRRAGTLGPVAPHRSS